MQQNRKIIIGGSIAIFFAVYFFYFQPNIQLMDYTIDNISKNAEAEVVYDLATVSGTGSFDYTVETPGEYNLIFSNRLSTFSKSVYVSIEGGWEGSDTFEIPAGEVKYLSFTNEVGDKIKGSFVIRGGTSDDVDLYIEYPRCNQYLSFSYSLINYGHSDGTAEVTIFSDDRSVSSNNYFVKRGELFQSESTISL